MTRGGGDRRKPHRVALVGIDGSGKSTVARMLRERAAGELAVVHTIRPHEAPGTALSSLTRHLASLSECADALGMVELKLAALHLQLAAYAPIERAVLESHRARTVLSDRHPVVDALTYLPLYGRIARTRADRTADPARHDWATTVPAEVLVTAMSWASRLGLGTNLVALGREVITLAEVPRAELVCELRRRLHTGPPDAVVLLDLDPAEALLRLRGRGRAGEMHETLARLAAVSGEYDSVVGFLAREYKVEVHRVQVGGDRDIDDVVADVAATVPRLVPGSVRATR